MGRVVGLIAVSALVVELLAGCAANPPAADVRTSLSTVVEASITEFDAHGGSETTSVGGGQYALIYDPSTVPGRQVVTVSLADASSPAFGDLSSIAIHSIKNLIASDEFSSAKVSVKDDTFLVSGDAFEADIQTRKGLVTQITLSAVAASEDRTQVVLMTYGITAEARSLFELAR